MEKKCRINKFRVNENGVWNIYQLPHNIEITEPSTIVFPFVMFTDIVEGLKEDYGIKTVEEYVQENDEYPNDDLFGYVLPFPFRNVMNLSKDYWTDGQKANLLIAMMLHHYNLPILPDEEQQK